MSFWIILLALISTVTALGYSFYRHQKIMRGRQAFHASPLRSMLAVGKTDASAARVWGRSESSGLHEFQIRRAADQELAASSFIVNTSPESDGTFSLKYPTDFEAVAPLEASTRYVCSVIDPLGQRVGQCSFETAPAHALDTPMRFAIAAMSCHLPFDDTGQLNAKAGALLAVLPDALELYNVKRVLLMGDQMYGDLPEQCSLLRQSYFRTVAPEGRTDLISCSREEVRSLYQFRHRLFWKTQGFRRIQSAFACHPILDDHEIIDNFGSSPAHAQNSHRALADGAMDAFYDYQGARALPLQHGSRPRAFYHDFEYGTLGVFVMDLRSERQATEKEIRIYSDEQFAALQNFLRQSHDKHVVCIVLSVPILHVPDWLAECGIAFASSDGDIEDRWANPKAQQSRNKLLGAIRDHQRLHPKQRVVLLGGDVHIGMVSQFKWGDGIRDSYQLVSSAVSNASPFDFRRIVQGVPDFKPIVGKDGMSFEADFLKPRDDLGSGSTADQNPYGQLNCGILEIERVSDDESTVRFMLLGCKGDSAAVSIAFDSGPL